MNITVIPAGQEPAEAEIQYVAYFLWVDKGRPEGCDLETWLTAKELIHNRHAPSAKPSHRRAKAPAARSLVGKN